MGTEVEEARAQEPAVNLLHALGLTEPGSEREVIRERGDVVHAWCEAVTWVDDGLPDDAALAALARRTAPRMTAAEVA